PPAKPERTVVLPLPDLVNRSFDEAKAVAAASGWKVSNPTTTRLDGTLKGQVLASSPSAGTRLRPGASIRFTVSDGQTIVAVPLDELPGKSVADATTVLAAAGFPARESATAYNEDIDEGLVIAAVESTTATAEKGSTIGLVVSKGPAPRTVPGGLVGGTQTGAKAALEAERLKMATVGTFSNSIPEGQVISVLPKSGTTVKRDSVVNVEVSKGPELRAVPSIAKAKSIAEAVAILRSAGFKDGSLSGPASGKPKRTSPPAGTMARPGSTVNIITG
ncbi:MAG: PASTA domain-containing protein, partial [Aquihabitans sp.]